MKSLYLSAFLILNCLFLVTAAPQFWDDDDLDFSIPTVTADCTRIGCPTGSKSCSKRTSTSTDRKLITDEIKCYNSTGQVTKDETASRQNPYPNSVQNSYEFFGSYTSGTVIGPGTNTGYTDNVETFNKK